MAGIQRNGKEHLVTKTETRVFARRVAIQLLSEDEIDSVVGGGPFLGNSPDSWCSAGGDASQGTQTNDDCTSDM